MTMRVPNLRSASGFTLLELLVALAIGTVLFAVLPSALGIAVRSTRTSMDVVNRGHETASLSALARLIEQAQPMFATSPEGERRLAFSGEPNRLAFVISRTDGPAGAGLYRVDLSSADGATRLSMTPLVDAGTAFFLATNETAATQNFSWPVTLRYRASREKDESAVWQPSWTQTAFLPDLVELQVGGVATPVTVEPMLRRRP